MFRKRTSKNERDYRWYRDSNDGGDDMPADVCDDLSDIFPQEAHHEGNVAAAVTRR